MEQFMKETNGNLDVKSLIQNARSNPNIMMICRHEYLGDFGKPAPEGWEPSDKEVWAVIDRIGL
jgi:hypothetical protein